MHSDKELKPGVSPFQHLEMLGLIKMTFKISLAGAVSDPFSIYRGLGEPYFLPDERRQCKETSTKKPGLLKWKDSKTPLM